MLCFLISHSHQKLFTPGVNNTVPTPGTGTAPATNGTGVAQ
ncbi:TPA: hypothetical protein ACG7P1_001481 [Streptococcus agalactiae]